MSKADKLALMIAVKRFSANYKERRIKVAQV